MRRDKSSDTSSASWNTSTPARNRSGCSVGRHQAIRPLSTPLFALGILRAIVRGRQPLVQFEIPYAFCLWLDP
ncbi:MAG: hypothetical protein R6V12_11475, partial [Candidatus Hydrogenedentota bacterium]